jgi:hypothetical protein
MNHRIDTELLKRVVRENIETLCQNFFPSGVKENGEWRMADTSGAEGKSLGICLDPEKAGVWYDRKTGEGKGKEGGFVNLLMKSRTLSFRAAAKEIGSCVGVNLEVDDTNGNGASHQSEKASFDWRELAKLSSEQREILCEWRGYSPSFVYWLAEHADLIRIYQSFGKDEWAFPISKSGEIRACHYRPMVSPAGEKVDWGVEPTNKRGGPGMQPLVLGDLNKALECHVFESLWDMLAACEKVQFYLGGCDDIAFFCTRGAGNGEFVGRIPERTKICAWMQNDEGGDKWLDRIRETLKRPFFRVDIPAAYKDLNDWTRDGASLDDLAFAQRGAKLIEVDPLDEKPKEEEDPLAWLKPKRVSELTTVQPDQILRGILYQACKMVLMAGSKSFKTWALMDIAYCVANGLLWWGVHTKQCPVFYLDWELLDFDFRWRMEQIAKAHGKGDPSLVQRFGLRGKKLIPEHWNKIYDYMLVGNAGLALADPTYKLLDDRDENKAGDIAEVTAIFDRLTIATGASIIYAQHFSKGNQAGRESIDRGAGSGVWARDADAITTMTKHKQGDDYLSIEHTLRSFARIDPFVVHWDFPLFSRQDDLDPSDLKLQANTGGREATFTVKDFMEVLGNKQFTTSEFLDVFIEKKKSSPATFHRLMAKAKKDGLIHKCAIDQKWEKVSQPNNG